MMPPKLRKCQHCEQFFKLFFHQDGSKILLPRKRKYCLSCVPYDPSKRQQVSKSKNTPDGKRPCLKCGDVKEIEAFSPTNKNGNRSSVCKNCAAKNNKIYQQKFKIQCIEYKGGKCAKCGYDKCPAAFDFHHKDPDQKDFNVSLATPKILNEKNKIELDKCELLCANCHREFHYQKIQEIQNVK